jgi:hypothetical protein
VVLNASPAGRIRDPDIVEDAETCYPKHDRCVRAI